MFAGLPEGKTFTVNGTKFQISYKGGDGNDVTLTAVCTPVAPLTITCPANVNSATAASCPIATTNVVNFPAPSTSGGCGGIQSLVCNPPSGSSFPVGTTTVTCTATDASGAVATCMFNVAVSSFCLQDETNPGNFVLINATTGDYTFFCNGVLIASGTGTLKTKACIGSIEHNKGDRRVYMEWDTTANGGKGAGTAIVQLGVNNTRCQITDKDMSNNTCTPPAPPTAPVRERQRANDR